MADKVEHITDLLVVQKGCLNLPAILKAKAKASRWASLRHGSRFRPIPHLLGHQGCVGGGSDRLPRRARHCLDVRRRQVVERVGDLRNDNGALGLSRSVHTHHAVNRMTSRCLCTSLWRLAARSSTAVLDIGGGRQTVAHFRGRRGRSFHWTFVGVHWVRRAGSNNVGGCCSRRCGRCLCGHRSRLFRCLGVGSFVLRHTCHKLQLGPIGETSKPNRLRRGQISPRARPNIMALKGER